MQRHAAGLWYVTICTFLVCPLIANMYQRMESVIAFLDKNLMI